MAQYKAAVENELDEEAKNNTEWNLHVKKKENPVADNKVSEEVVKFVKAFLAQNVAPERCGPPICYNCGTQGHISVYCTQTCTECGKSHHGTKCPVRQEHINRRLKIQRGQNSTTSDQMMLELMAVEKHPLTPPTRGGHKVIKNNQLAPDDAILETLQNMTFPPREPPKTATPAKVYPDPSRHQPPATYAEAAAKRMDISHESHDEPKRNRVVEPSPTRAPSPVKKPTCEQAPSPDLVLTEQQSKTSPGLLHWKNHLCLPLMKTKS
ncbi:hypothetical protein DSO57_1000285 [Entomophthora muscae]|uniref:Uncharacterized protein n=1 Tax=Entomophthora muscae TaxID=34485 RepID=A0ACC2SYP2_9FUNG|nr:hypothetical protein DSO57_1000285 [Entomophthora muscae]